MVNSAWGIIFAQGKLPDLLLGCLATTFVIQCDHKNYAFTLYIFFSILFCCVRRSQDSIVLLHHDVDVQRTLSALAKISCVHPYLRQVRESCGTSLNVRCTRHNCWPVVKMRIRLTVPTEEFRMA